VRLDEQLGSDLLVGASLGDGAGSVELALAALVIAVAAG